MTSILRLLEDENEKNADKDKSYNWEQGFERSWEDIDEDENGLLRAPKDQERQLQKRRQMQIARSIQKGMIRYVYLVVDLSRGMLDNDFRPNRQAVLLQLLENFIIDFFDQNPLSHIGIIVTRNGKAEKITDLLGNPKRQVEALRANFSIAGEPSLQNSLELARLTLKVIPAYGSCEVVMVYGSLSTSDPGDIHTTIQALKAEKVRCSVVGLGAEMYILKRIAEETQGTYSVALDKEHLQDLMKQFLQPLPKISKSSVTFASLVQMGFPHKRQEKFPSLCACHQEFKTVGFLCPRCLSRVCELPTTCPICSLPLVSSPQLARSYHHLFPVEPFTEKKSDSSAEDMACFSCLQQFVERDLRLQCPHCQKTFCNDCDIFIHESLHNCPGCQQAAIKSTSAAQ